jgi:hypothetical protein
VAATGLVEVNDPQALFISLVRAARQRRVRTEVAKTPGLKSLDVESVANQPQLLMEKIVFGVGASDLDHPLIELVGNNGIRALHFAADGVLGSDFETVLFFLVVSAAPARVDSKPSVSVSASSGVIAHHSPMNCFGNLPDCA